MTDFDVAFNYLILEDESSKYSDDPDDSGGPTKWGVTLATYNDFFRVKAMPQEIEEMPASEAKQIYRTKYWAPLGCEKISDLAFQCAIFDAGVLYGVATTALIVQRALLSRGASIKLDGILGDKSVEVLNQYILGGEGLYARGSMMQTIRDLLLERIDAVIVANPKDEKYRHGWSLRADRLLQLLNDEFLNKYKEEIFT